MINFYLIPHLFLTIGSVAVVVLALLRLGWGKPLRGNVRWLLPLSGLVVLTGFSAEAARLLNWLPTTQDAFLARLPYYALFGLALLLLFFSRVFLEDSTFQVRWLAGGVAWLGLVLVLDANPFHLPDILIINAGLGIIRSGAAQVALAAGSGGLLLAAALTTARALREEDLPYERNPIHYWALSLSLAALGGGLYFAGWHTWTGMLLLFAAGGLGSAVFFIPYLPDFRRSLYRMLGFLLVTGLSFIFYIAGYVLIEAIFYTWPGDQPLLPGVILAVMLIVLFNPTLRWIQERLDRVVPRRNKYAGRILRQYSQSITNVLDLQLLATVAIGTASEALDIRRGFLFLVDFEKDSDGQNRFHLRGVKGMGTTNPPVGLLSENSPLAGYLRHEHYPITVRELREGPHFKSMPVAELEWLHNLGVEILAPVYVKEEWIGMIALGPRVTGEPFLEENRDLLAMLADQTAIAMENVRLVEGLMRLNNDFRRAYAALEQSNRHLERLDRTKTDFISVASHELRTPLTVISASCQMLMDEPDFRENPYYNQMLGKIDKGTLRLNEIVDSLLDVAKIDSRALELDPQPVSIKSLVDSVHSELFTAFNERQQTFLIEDLGSLPPVEADQEALRKVFYHIIINAVKYTPDGGTISVSGKVIQPSEDERLPFGGVEVGVHDTGIGIDPRHKDLIFAKFYQTGELVLHSSGKTKFKGGGPGLGLAIARGIVEAHNGYIWAESPGHDENTCPGADIFVRLPLCQEIPAAPVLTENPAEEPAEIA